ncbi:MAG: hypothetical protein KF858_11775 [Candidatus Sumerlaeia bacterium]|nr:hypothetical protein [Candidatus Sumerlaeia bacterium]
MNEPTLQSLAARLAEHEARLQVLEAALAAAGGEAAPAAKDEVPRVEGRPILETAAPVVEPAPVAETAPVVETVPAVAASPIVGLPVTHPPGFRVEAVPEAPAAGEAILPAAVEPEVIPASVPEAIPAAAPVGVSEAGAPPSLSEAMRARRAARAAKVDFLSEHEYAGQTADAPEPEPREPVSLEVLLAKWLPVVGGALVTVGVAFFATLVDVPWLKVALGYVIAAALGGAGLLVLGRSQAIGRATVAVALSVGFFVSFASHYIEASRALPAVVALALMAAFCAGIFLTAERWRSQLVAAVGLGLGLLAALISAKTSEGFALLALGTLAVGAGWLLVRHEWKTLAVLAVVGSYLGTALLWAIMPIGSGSAEIVTHLGALALYHAVFAASFWRWGRMWSARERAVEAAVREGAPRVEMPQTIFSAAGALLNSLFLSVLSVTLLWVTRTLWDQVHWLLTALALLETVRLSVRALRRGVTVPFHVLLAAVLATSAAASAFAGLTESCVVAALAAAIAIAGARLRDLRWLRPITVGCAFLATQSFNWGTPATFFDLLVAMLPGLFLISSCLPWERLLTGQVYSRNVVLRGLEFLSSQVRGLIAGVMLVVPLFAYLDGDALTLCAIGVIFLLLSAGLLFLGAGGWLLATVAAAMVFWVGTFELADDGLHLVAIGIGVWLAAFVLWQMLSRRPDAWTLRGMIAGTPEQLEAPPSGPRFGVAVRVAIAGAAAVGFASSMWAAARHWDPFVGLGMMVLGTVAAGCGWMTLRLPAIRPIGVRADKSDDVAPTPTRAWDRILAPGVAAGLAAAFVGAIAAVVVDARDSLVSAGVPAAVGAGLWLVMSMRRPGALLPTLGALAAGTLVLFPAIMVAGNFAPREIQIVVTCSAVLGVIGLAWRNAAAVVTSGVWMLAAMTLVPATMLDAQRRGAEGWGAHALLAAVLILATALLPRFAHRRLALADDHPVARNLAHPMWESVFAVVGSFLTLMALTIGDVLAASLITASWAAIGIAVLLTGFALDRAPLRYTALGVFVAAVGRLFVFELANASLAVKAGAFLAVGLVIVAAGIAYAFRARKA